MARKMARIVAASVEAPRRLQRRVFSAGRDDIVVDEGPPRVLMPVEGGSGSVEQARGRCAGAPVAGCDSPVCRDDARDGLGLMHRSSFS